MCFHCLTPEEVFERLIVDDGQLSRGQRKNIFNCDFSYCGIATGPHSNLDSVVLLEYAKVILKDGEHPSINITVTDEVPLELIQRMSKKALIKLFLF